MAWIGGLFFKPKSPGFGISPNYYLSVLASASVLPSIRDLVQPKPDRASVLAGFGAPLEGGEPSKEALAEPMRRGPYVFSTPDRKTLLRLLVMGVDEAHFDPVAYAESLLAIGEKPDLIARMRGAWTISQLTFESHHPAVFPSLLFAWQLVSRLAELSDGVVADPVSERYLLPSDAFHPPEDFPIDVRDLVVVKALALPTGLYCYTLGLQKLGLPEFELTGLEDAAANAAEFFLLGLSQTALSGEKIAPGHRVGSAAEPFTVAVGGLDRGRWEGVACLELLPPTQVTVTHALETWVRESRRG
jgi:hypothetical protein